MLHSTSSASFSLGRHTRASINYALAMARVSFVVAAITMVFHFAAANPEPSTIVTIQNNFPTHNLTVQCDSNIKAHPDVHLVVPKDRYIFSFYPNMEHRWTFTLSMEKIGEASNGKFIMWQNHLPFQPTPIWEPMCGSQCPWFVDADGLSLIWHPGSEPEHIYDWPGHNC